MKKLKIDNKVVKLGDFNIDQVMVPALKVDGKIVATGDYNFEIVDEEPKYTIKVNRYEYLDIDDIHGCEDIVWYCNHRRYRLDDEIETLMDYARDNFDIDTDESDWFSKLVEQDKDYAYYPVYAIDHSGIHLMKYPHGSYYNWDGGLFAIARYKKSCFGPDTNFDSLFDADFREVRALFDGEVYGYNIYNEVGDLVDSCGSIINSYDKNEDFFNEIKEMAGYGLTIEDVKQAFENMEN